MIAFPMHHARPGALALAALLALPGCTIAIGAPPEGAPATATAAAPRTQRQRPQPRPRDQIYIPASRPAESEGEAPATEPAPAEEAVEMEEAVLAPGASLLIPVRGVRPDQLRDSYDHARSGGRVHNAIDIMAPGGTPVLAAADGTIHRLRTGGLGGVTLYQLGQDGRTLYYYAHLQRYAAGIRDGTPVVRGQVIAYVGDTGNAGAGNYHLHFSVGRLRDPDRWWESDNVNPYPLLAGDFARASDSRERR
ncbi:MAG TPA: M23 family metallopeptidase [Longimicrobium sp.]|nr:M23 family metallopeptidase [Longimicrobium sp.]